MYRCTYMTHVSTVTVFYVYMWLQVKLTSSPYFMPIHNSCGQNLYLCPLFNSLNLDVVVIFGFMVLFAIFFQTFISLVVLLFWYFNFSMLLHILCCLGIFRTRLVLIIIMFIFGYFGKSMNPYHNVKVVIIN